MEVVWSGYCNQDSKAIRTGQVDASRPFAIESVLTCSRERAHGTKRYVPFGHEIEGRYATQSLVPFWRGAALGATLCRTCMRTMVNEMKDPCQPLVVENIPPPKKAKAISRKMGPCHFGHTHTSACDLNGEPSWFCMPTGFTWKGAKPGDTLCNACIVKMRRSPH